MSQKSTRHLVDSELLGALALMPPYTLTREALPLFRKLGDLSLPEDPEAVENVELVRQSIPGRPGDPDIGICLHTPRKRGVTRGAILHIHGGGYVTGSAGVLSPVHRKLAFTLDCVILSVDYRLAPETPFPGPVEDCYAALAWLVAQATELEVDPTRIGVMGESAGGGLAAGLALLVRDRGEYSLAFQHLIYPMIDDRTCVSADPNPYAGEFVWDRHNNRFGWEGFLGQPPGGEGVSPYAAAARATDLSGLPPTFISTAALDLFVDENLDYARRLIRAGVPTELHLYPGAFHAFQVAAHATVTASADRDAVSALKRALRKA